MRLMLIAAAITALPYIASAQVLTDPSLSDQARSSATLLQPTNGHLTERSALRTWSGIAVMAVGTVGLLTTEQESFGFCLSGFGCVEDLRWPKGRIVATSATMVVGTLMTTIWSDIPVGSNGEATLSITGNGGILSW